MTFTEQEKLTLFLIWWHCVYDGYFLGGEPTEEIYNKFERCYAFHKFLSEAHEAEGSYEFWVSDFDLEDIKESAIQNCPVLMNFKDYYFKNRIRITIEQNND